MQETWRGPVEQAFKPNCTSACAASPDQGTAESEQQSQNSAFLAVLLPALQKLLPANPERADGRSPVFAHHSGSRLALPIPALLLLSLVRS